MSDPAASAPAPRAFDAQQIDIGPARLVGVENGPARVILWLEDKDGTLLIFIDPRKGIETGRLRLNNLGERAWKK